MSSSQIRLYVQWTQTETSHGAFLILMRFDFTEITHVWVHFFLKLVNQEKLTQDLSALVLSKGMN